MLIKAAHVFQTTSSLAYSSSASFSYAKATPNPSKVKINRSLLYPFEKNQTLRALQDLQDQQKLELYNTRDLIVLDKLSSTIDTETFRTFNTQEKKFVAVKNISLDSSTNSWKQVNLTLRQFHKNFEHALTPNPVLQYDKSEQRVQIFTQIPRKTLWDELMFRKEKRLPWTTSDLKAVLFQLLKEINTQKELGAYCINLNPKEIYLDEVQNSLKIFDFSGFEVDPDAMNNLRWLFGPYVNFDVALVLLAQMIDPANRVNNIKDARYSLKKLAPEFLADVDGIRQNMKNFFKGDSFDLKISDSDSAGGKPFGELAANIYRDYFPYNSTNNESWALLNQELKNFSVSEKILKSELNTNLSSLGYLHEKTCKSYFNLAELYKDMGKTSLAFENFGRALTTAYSLPSPDKVFLARLNNQYGKLLAAENRTTEAREVFKKAQEAIKESSGLNSPLAAEIAENLEGVRSYTEDFSDYVNQWKTYTDEYLKKFMGGYGEHASKHFNNGAEKFEEHMKQFGARMEKFGEEMSKMGHSSKWHHPWSWGWRHYGRYGGHRGWGNWNSHASKWNQSGCGQKSWGWGWRNYHHYDGARGFSCWHKGNEGGFIRRSVRWMFRIWWRIFWIWAFCHIMWRCFFRKDRHDDWHHAHTSGHWHARYENNGNNKVEKASAPAVEQNNNANPAPEGGQVNEEQPQERRKHCGHWGRHEHREWKWHGHEHGNGEQRWKSWHEWHENWHQTHPRYGRKNAETSTQTEPVVVLEETTKKEAAQTAQREPVPEPTFEQVLPQEMRDVEEVQSHKAKDEGFSFFGLLALATTLGLVI